MVLPFKGSPKSIKEIGRELGVKALVLSRMSRPSGRLHVVVEIVDTETENILWANDYDGAMEDYIVLQSDLARDVVRHARVRLTPDEQARLAKSKEVSPEAYEKYLNAQKILFTSFGYERAGEKALILIKEAMTLEPDFAKFHSFAASLYMGSWFNGDIPFREVVKPIREEIQKTLSLDPESGDALGVQAIDYQLTFQWKKLLAVLREASENSPSDISWS